MDINKYIIININKLTNINYNYNYINYIDL